MKKESKTATPETANAVELFVQIKVREEATPSLFRFLQSFKSEAAHLIVEYLGDCLIDLDEDPDALEALKQMKKESKVHVC